MDQTVKRIGLLIVILGLIAVSSIFVALVLSFAPSAGTAFSTGNVAVIPIKGVITTGEDFWSDTTDPKTVRQWLSDAEADDAIEMIVLEINSPGGSAVASDEIGQALKHTTKPTVALIRDVGASGGYWIASNTDYIIANRMSITGSVGVTASFIDFSGTLRRYNASYEQLIGGKYKEVGTPFQELSSEERALLQSKIDRIHQYFLTEVQQNRNLSDQQMQRIRTGEFFLGIEAYELGLVDELGSWSELDSYINQTIDSAPAYVYYEEPKTFFEELASVRTSLVPDLTSGVTLRT